MALTDYDKKTLNKAQQQAVQAATDKWNAANAKGDTAGMQAAAAEAAAVRNSAGYKTDSYGNYTGSYSPTSSGGSSSGSSSSGNSQYTGVGTNTDSSVSEWAKKQIDSYKAQYNEAAAKGDTAGMQAAHAAAEAIRERYGYSGGADGSEYIQLEQNEFEFEEEQPEYNNKYDPQIEALLNEILNREDFSYDVANDPLYQQYANIYRREGDRAMKETMAEAAAGAGGMNTYAITAAQQANSYYNSQLNDKIPELYQLAYEMYLNDKESKVQDLGILQSMDATQYNRYRDTMEDWRNDRNFAYGMYRDDVADKQWQTTFDYNDYWANKNFDYNDAWANKEWDANQADKDLANSRYDTETAYNRIMELIANGVTTIDPALIEKAGITQDAVNQMIANKQAEMIPQARVSNEEEEEEKPVDTSHYTLSNSHNEDSNWIHIPGWGRVTYEEAAIMAEEGTITETFDHKNKKVYYSKA